MIRSSIFVCVMTVAVFCLHRYYEMTKYDTRDYISCHPLLLLVQNSLGICSSTQKISRLLAFGTREDRLSAVQALITSPHDVSKDHVKYLVDIIADSESAHEISVAITSLSHITDGRLDISQEIIRHKKVSQVFSKLFELNDLSWWPILHNLFLRLASAVRTPSDVSYLLEEKVVKSIIEKLKFATDNKPTIQQIGALQFLAVASSHILIAAHIHENQQLMNFLQELSQNHHSSSTLSEGPIFATQILENIQHFLTGHQDVHHEQHKLQYMQNDTVDQFSNVDLLDGQSNVIVETDGSTSTINSSELEKIASSCDTEECLIQVDSTNIVFGDNTGLSNIENISPVSPEDREKTRRKRAPKKRQASEENGQGNTKKSRPKRKPVDSFTTESNRDESETRPRGKRRKQQPM